LAKIVEFVAFTVLSPVNMKKERKKRKRKRKREEKREV